MKLLNYEIVGQASPFLELSLAPAQTIIAQAGAMIYAQEHITLESKLGDGTQEDNLFKNIFSAGKRVLAGESPFLTHFKNTDTQVRKVAFGSPFPASIVPVALGKLSSQSAVFQRDSFLCASFGTEISPTIHENIGAGVLGGEGLILQKLQGEGMAFVYAGGTVIEKELAQESLRVEAGAIVGFSTSISIEVERIEGANTSWFGGETLFMAVLKGTGKVWLQSMPFHHLVGKIAQKMAE